jgi:hypothetical protein
MTNQSCSVFGAIGVQGAIITGSDAGPSALDISQTWNTTGAPSGLKVNITNTASGDNAKLVDIQEDGVTRIGFLPASDSLKIGPNIAHDSLFIKTLKESVTAAAGATLTTTLTIPKYAFLVGVTTYVSTELGGTVTGYTVGNGTDADLWGDVTGVVAGTKTGPADYTATGAVGHATADRNVVLTAKTANFNGTGVIEVCAHYISVDIT